MRVRVTVRCARQRRLWQRGEHTVCRGWRGTLWQTGHRGNSTMGRAYGVRMPALGAFRLGTRVLSSPYRGDTP